MGVEQSLMRRLWDYAAVPNPRVTDRLPKPLPGKPQDKDLKDSPNQRGLRRSVWCLEAALANDEKAWNDAVYRALDYFADLRKWGHMSDGENGRTEIFTASHRQLWYALMAGFLWAGQIALSKRWTASELLDAATRFWRLETIVAKRCHYEDKSRLARKGKRTKTTFSVLVPGARMGDPARPMATNESTDELIEALAGGSFSQKNPRTADNGSYTAAVPLLKKALVVGLNTRTLIGDDLDLAAIHTRLGWHLKGSAPGNYYAWFDSLGYPYDGLHGAGFVDGEVVLKWDRNEAVAYGESLQL